MTQLTTTAFDRAAEFITNNARPLERSLFDFHFGHGSVEQVLTELAKFQNDDGGFGHGVEPDVRTPLSSPFAASVAFQVLRELGVNGDRPIVSKGVAYFVQSFDRSVGGWDPIGPHGDEYPHAPWWNYRPVAGQLDPVVRANPGAEITGYLHLYSDQSDSGFVHDVTAGILSCFDELPDGMEFHSMICFTRLAEMAPGPVAERILPKLRRGVELVVGKSPDDWKRYGARPLWFAPKPDSLLAEVLQDSIQAQLDYEIAEQYDDGSWQPNWTWGQYEDEWLLAKVEWAGYLTLRALLALKAWNRI
ncbi:MAG: hypothetical protein O3B95_06560 [Chloroflexi bacterium]|nr:hypothetical protein [Chloroflexota bacterium]